MANGYMTTGDFNALEALMRQNAGQGAGSAPPTPAGNPLAYSWGPGGQVTYTSPGGAGVAPPPTPAGNPLAYSWGPSGQISYTSPRGADAGMTDPEIIRRMRMRQLAGDGPGIGTGDTQQYGGNPLAMQYAALTGANKGMVGGMMPNADQTASLAALLGQAYQNPSGARLWEGGPTQHSVEKGPDMGMIGAAAGQPSKTAVASPMPQRPSQPMAGAPHAPGSWAQHVQGMQQPGGGQNWQQRRQWRPPSQAGMNYAAQVASKGGAGGGGGGARPWGQRRPY